MAAHETVAPGRSVVNEDRVDRWARVMGRRDSRRAVVARGGGALLAGAAAGTPRSASGQEATPGASQNACPATTPEANKAMVERYWAEVWTAGGEAAIADLLAADEVHHWGVGDDTVGHEAFAERLRAFLTAFPDFAVRIDQLVAEGELVVSRWTATASHGGEWLGVAPTGTTVEYTGFNLFRIACGRIAEGWGEADHLGLLRQLGGVPDVAPPVATPSAG